MKTTTEKARALCYAIEAAGASEQLTACSVLASELLAETIKLAERDAKLASQLKWHGEETFPAEPSAQKHFARVVMESIADELTTGATYEVLA